MTSVSPLQCQPPDGQHSPIQGAALRRRWASARWTPSEVAQRGRRVGSENGGVSCEQAKQLSRGLIGARRAWLSVVLTLIVLWLLGGLAVHAQTTSPANWSPIHITVGGGNQRQSVDMGIKILFAITLLTLAPSIVLLMTCFTRVVIVLSFVRTALQLQGAPANQIIVGLSLFITFFVMAPVWRDINQQALAPYQAGQITGTQALDRAGARLRTFMLKQTRPKDVELFVSLANLPPTPPNELPLKVVTPAYIVSELRTAFQQGFLLFVPFILIDLVVATVLMSMGMMMMPPTTISLPLKILLFVLVDGWDLVVRSLIRSFGS